VTPLLALDPRRAARDARLRQPAAYARHEGGTSPVAARLRALRRMGEAGYPLASRSRPIIAAPGWEEPTAACWSDARAALAGLPDPDLTVS
jgi:spore photoproduct lyase